MLPFAPITLFGVSALIPMLGALVGWRYALARRLPGWTGTLLGLSGPVGWLMLAVLGGETTGGWGGPAEEEAPGWNDQRPPSPRLERWARRLYRPTLFGWAATIVGVALLIVSNMGSATPPAWFGIGLALVGVATVVGTFGLWGLGFSMLLSDTRLPRRRRAAWGASLLWLSAPAALLFHRWRWRRLRALSGVELSGGAPAGAELPGPGLAEAAPARAAPADAAPARTQLADGAG